MPLFDDSTCSPRVGVPAAADHMYVLQRSDGMAVPRIPCQVQLPGEGEDPRGKGFDYAGTAQGDQRAGVREGGEPGQRDYHRYTPVYVRYNVNTWGLKIRNNNVHIYVGVTVAAIRLDKSRFRPIVGGR